MLLQALFVPVFPTSHFSLQPCPDLLPLLTCLFLACLRVFESMLQCHAPLVPFQPPVRRKYPPNIILQISSKYPPVRRKYPPNILQTAANILQTAANILRYDANILQTAAKYPPDCRQYPPVGRKYIYIYIYLPPDSRQYPPMYNDCTVFR